MRTREIARKLVQDVLAGKHSSQSWWSDLSGTIKFNTGLPSEVTLYRERGEDLKKLWIVALGYHCRELIFDERDCVSLRTVGEDQTKALEAYGPGWWRSTWVDVFRSLRGKNFFNKNYVGTKRVVAGRRNKARAGRVGCGCNG